MWVSPPTPAAVRELRPSTGSWLGEIWHKPPLLLHINPAPATNQPCLVTGHGSREVEGTPLLPFRSSTRRTGHPEVCIHRPAPGYGCSQTPHWGQRQQGGMEKNQLVPAERQQQQGWSGGGGGRFALQLPGTGCGFAVCRRARSMQCGCVPWAPSDVLCASSGTKVAFSL